MEDKACYTPAEVAQICAAYMRVYGQPSSTMKEIGKYEQLVPKNVQESIGRLNRTVDMFYERTGSSRQKDSLQNLEFRVQSCRDFEEFLKLYEMIE